MRVEENQTSFTRNILNDEVFEESGFACASFTDDVNVGKAVFGFDGKRLLDASIIGFADDV